MTSRSTAGRGGEIEISSLINEASASMGNFAAGRSSATPTSSTSPRRAPSRNTHSLTLTGRFILLIRRNPLYTTAIAFVIAIWLFSGRRKNQTTPGDGTPSENVDHPSPVTAPVVAPVVSPVAASPVAAPAAEFPSSDDETPPDETPSEETPSDETPSDETPTDDTAADGTPTDEPTADGDEIPADDEVTDDEAAVDDDAANDVGTLDDAVSVDAEGTPSPTASSQTPSPTASPTTEAERIPTETLREQEVEGTKRPEAEWSDTYMPRARPRSESELGALAAEWGSWTFVDPKADQRPSIDYESYPNRDIPLAEFPEGAWQTDPEYLEGFISAAMNLTSRTLGAILAEYGHGKDDQPNATFSEREYMFNLSIYDHDSPYNMRNPPGNAGVITDTALEDLKRYLLHAIMTEDQFIFAMGGHAAGHGNLFQQSYTAQVQKVLEPVLARLGVFHKSHNYAMNAHGTMHSTLAFRSLYGPEIDLLMWDAPEVEEDGTSEDIFARQGILGGNRVPVLWGSENAFGYYERAGVGAGTTGFPNAGSAGLPVMQNATIANVSDMPWATQWLMCDHDTKQTCYNLRFNNTCWIERDDVQPPTEQDEKAATQGGKYPGFRLSQLQGRMIAYTVLRQLYAALEEWKDKTDYTLPDEAWHVTARYESVRRGVLAATDTPCKTFEISDLICNVEFQGVTEYTPRYRPIDNSIRSIIKPGGKIPQPDVNVYDPPDVYNPFLDVPEGALDLVAIIENGVPFQPNRGRTKHVNNLRKDLAHSRADMPPLKNPSSISPGFGLGLHTPTSPNNCDGSYDSFCNRAPDNKCLLYGHNDYRGGIILDEFSGWLVVNLKDVKEGIIIVKIDDAFGAFANPETEGWVCVNGATNCAAATQGGDADGEGGGRRQRQLRSPVTQEHEERRTRGQCKDYIFEYAVEGHIHTWDHEKFKGNEKQLRKGLNVWELVKEMEGETRDLELAMRLSGTCGRSKTFLVTHIYWA